MCSSDLEDVDFTVAKIHEIFGKNASAWLHVTYKPNKDALADMPAGDLKRIGIALTSTGDQVVVKPVDGEVDKIVTALLKEQAEVQ